MILQSDCVHRCIHHTHNNYPTISSSFFTSWFNPLRISLLPTSWQKHLSNTSSTNSPPPSSLLLVLLLLILILVLGSSVQGAESSIVFISSKSSHPLNHHDKINSHSQNHQYDVHHLHQPSSSSSHEVTHFRKEIISPPPPSSKSSNSLLSNTFSNVRTTSQQQEIPIFSIPSSLTLYSNTPLQIPILLTSPMTTKTKFEYSWKITCCYSREQQQLVSDQVIVLKSGTSSLISMGEYDQDVIGNFTQFYRNFGVSSSYLKNSSIGWRVDLDITGRGDFDVITYQASKTIDVNFKLLGAHASIKGENQEFSIREGTTNVTITPIIQNYDRLFKKIDKSLMECKWSCQYMDTTKTDFKNCSNFESFNTFSNSNCRPINLADKIEGNIINVDHFLVGITYRYLNLYYIESEKYTITLIPLAFNDSSPVILSLESNIDMLQYHPPNTAAFLYPVFTQLVYNTSQTKTLIFYWENEQTGDFFPYRNLTLSSLEPNTLYSMKCTVYYVGKPQQKSSMRLTFRTANSISKPTFNLLTSSIEAFTTRVQWSGNLGTSSANESLCFTQVFAETSTYGNVSLTNGGFLCLNNDSSTTILTLRLPLRRVADYDTIKLYFMITDGITQELFTFTSSSKSTVITNVVTSDKMSQTLLSVFNSQQSSTFENEKPFLPSQLLVATYIMNDFYTYYGKAILMSTSDYGVMASTYSTLLMNMNSYCNQDDSFFENVKCLRFLGAMLGSSKLTTTFSTYSSTQQYSSTSSLIFREIQKFLYNLSLRSGTILSDYMTSLYMNQVGEKYTGDFFEYIPQAYQAISPARVYVTFYNNLIVEMNSNTISDSSFKLSQYMINSSDKLSSFSTSFSFMTKVKLDTFSIHTTFSLKDSIQVQLPELMNILRAYSNSDTFIVSLQITPPNNVTDSPCENVKVSSKKLQFQIMDSQTNSKIPLSNLTSPILLKLPILTGSSNASLGNSSSSKCVYFDESLSTWSTNGCNLVNTTLTDFYCECNHTTLFSTLTNLSGNSNITTPEVTFTLIPLIVISSVTGGVILMTLGVATIIQCILHLYRNTISFDSVEFLLPGEFKPHSHPRKTASPKQEQPPVKTRYRDLTFGKKIWECLKEFHPMIGLVFPKRYFKRIHIKKVDRLVILMVIFMTISTTNVLLLSTNYTTSNWAISIPAAVALGAAELFQIPVILCVAVKSLFWKVTGYAYSSLLAFACLILSILGSAGVFTRQKLNMDILNWLYNTLIALAWDLIVLKLTFAACMAFLLEIKITIEVEIEEYRKKKRQQTMTLDQQPSSSSNRRVMITVENNVKIPKLALHVGQFKKPPIPKLNFHGKIEGYTSPKDNNINELSSLHASESERSDDDFTATTNTSEMLSGHYLKQTPKENSNNHVNNHVNNTVNPTATTTTLVTTISEMDPSNKNETNSTHVFSNNLTNEEKDIEKMNDFDQQLIVHSSQQQESDKLTTTSKTEDCNTEDLSQRHSNDENDNIQSSTPQQPQEIISSNFDQTLDDEHSKDTTNCDLSITMEKNEKDVKNHDDSELVLNSDVKLDEKKSEQSCQEDLSEKTTTRSQHVDQDTIVDAPHVVKEELNLELNHSNTFISDNEIQKVLTSNTFTEIIVIDDQVLTTEKKDDSPLLTNATQDVSLIIEKFIKQQHEFNTRDSQPHECFNMSFFMNHLYSDVKIQFTEMKQDCKLKYDLTKPNLNEEEKKHFPKEKCNKDILEYISEILNTDETNDMSNCGDVSSNQYDLNDIFSEIPFEKLQGKAIHEILVLISEYESELLLLMNSGGGILLPPSLVISSLVKNATSLKKGITNVNSPISRGGGGGGGVNSPTSPIRSNSISKNILASASSSSSGNFGLFSATAKVIRGGGVNLDISTSSLDHHANTPKKKLNFPNNNQVNNSSNLISTRSSNSLNSLTGGYSRSRTSSFYKPYEIEDHMIRVHTQFFSRFRKFIMNHPSAKSLFLNQSTSNSNNSSSQSDILESKRKKALNELLLLQTVYLHFKLLTVTTERRKLMAKQIIAKFVSDEQGEYYVNVGFYKRVLSSLIADENLNANCFERACEIVEISLKPILAAFLNYLCGHMQEKTMKDHTQATSEIQSQNNTPHSNFHGEEDQTNKLKQDQHQDMWTV
nr:unnamed protein product [Naegleria fowleri]